MKKILTEGQAFAQLCTWSAIASPFLHKTGPLRGLFQPLSFCHPNTSGSSSHKPFASGHELCCTVNPWPRLFRTGYLSSYSTFCLLPPFSGCIHLISSIKHLFQGQSLTFVMECHFDRKEIEKKSVTFCMVVL